MKKPPVIRRFYVVFCLFLFLRIGSGRDECGDRHRKDGSDTGSKSGDQFNGKIRRRQQLILSQIQGIQIQDQYETASQESQYESAGHRSDHILTDIHAGKEELFERQIRIGIVDFTVV